MTLVEVLELLGIPYPRDHKISCPTGHGTGKTPSLHLYEDTNSFYCFSCGATGDAYGLIALATGQNIVDVLKQYGDGQEGKPARPKATRQGMMEAVIAEWQEWQATYWAKLQAYKNPHLLDAASAIIDDAFGGPLTANYVPEDVTPAELRRQIDDVLVSLQVLLDNYRAVSHMSELLGAAVQSEVPQTGGPGGDGVRRDAPTRQVGTVRVEQTRRDDGEDVGADQASARLLRRIRLSR